MAVPDTSQREVMNTPKSRSFEQLINSRKRRTLHVYSVFFFFFLFFFLPVLRYLYIKATSLQLMELLPSFPCDADEREETDEEREREKSRT